jgi:molybdate transport system substrate-binding protein
MTIRSVSRAVAALVVASIAQLGAQSSPPLRVFASNGFRAVFDELAPRCEKTVGRQLSTDFGTSTSLQQRVKGGEAFDVAVMTSEAIDDLVTGGKLTQASLVPLGRSGIGIGVHAGAPKPDIKTPDALKQALLNAKAITYAGDGASRPYIESMMNALGITKAVAAKTILEQGSVRAAANVASGKADVLITLVSEILPAPGVDLVGPLPARFQHYVSFAAATGVKSDNSEAGKLLIACLSGPDALGTLKARGMERTSNLEPRTSN